MSAREATCPACGPTFDPLRSKAGRVRHGKAVAVPQGA